MGADQHGANAAEQHRAGDGRNTLLAHAFADQGKGFLGGLVGRGQVIRLVEIDLVDFPAAQKGRNLQRLVAVGDGGGDLLGFKDDIVALRDLVALDLVVALDRAAGFGIDEFAPDPIGDIAYLCGNPDMVDACAELLKAAGLGNPQIRREKYVSSK